MRICQSIHVCLQKPPHGNPPWKITPATVTVEELAHEMMLDGARPGRSILLRERENGRVESVVWNRRVWEWPAGEEAAEELWLIVREAADGTLKYSLNNAPAATSLTRLAR